MFKQKFVVQFGSTIIPQLLTMVAGLVVTRVAGPEVVGVIAYGTAFVSLFLFATGLFGTSHIKMISEGQDEGKCMGTYLRLQIIAIIIYIFLVIGWFLIQKHIINYQFTKTQIIVIWLTFGATILANFLNFPQSTFTAKIQLAKANTPNFLYSILFNTGRIIIVLIGFRAVGLAAWKGLSLIILLPVTFYLIKQLKFGTYDKNLSKKYLKISFPVFIMVITNSLIQYSDKLILDHFNDVKELGYYTAAYSIGGLVITASIIAGAVFFPLFSKYIKESNWVSINQKISSFHNFSFLFILPGVCFLALIADPLIPFLLGDRYLASVKPFMVLLFSSFVLVWGMPYGNIITGMGLFSTAALLNFMKFLVFTISLYFLLNPKYMGLGALGLAINTFIVNIFHNLLFWIVSKRKGKLIHNHSHLLIFTINILLFGITFWILNGFQIFETMRWRYFLFIGYLPLNFFLLWLFGFLNKQSILLLTDLLNINKTIKYISGEFNNEKK